jgi:isopenicillin-N N-acyltransferase-like protein
MALRDGSGQRGSNSLNRSTYPVLRVRGSPRQRGVAYGEAFQARIRKSFAAYRAAFEAYNLPWKHSMRIAERWRPSVADCAPEAFEEITGIAEGANVEPLAILALNLRTEILASIDQSVRTGECTAFAVLPYASANNHVLLAENWDWMVHSRDTVVVLEVERDDAPAFTTFVEAGLVAKIGLNSAGIGIATNALRGPRDPIEGGVPYHIVLRMLFDASTKQGALQLLQSLPHASSANFLVASADGTAVDVEVEAGDAAGTRVAPICNGVMTHTNHFLTGRQQRVDLGLTKYPSTVSRLETAQTLINHLAPITLEMLRDALANHSGYPLSICAHPDMTAPSAERGLTAASLIMDLNDAQVLLADGNPCSQAHREIDCSWLRFAKHGPYSDRERTSRLAV